MASLQGLILARAMSQSARLSVPKKPVHHPLKPRAPVVIPIETIHLLEKLSLVRFGEVEAVRRVEEAATFAQAIFDVDTTGVQPLYTVLEDRGVELRDDIAEGWNPSLVLNNTSVMEEGYIVAPPGNIPLEKIENLKE
ncbi:glutamyl-tRNA(Gln) amidotransferase subunit C [Tropilaelaps mercedesae]|uniref:Glutamyl-tRNA(Gln) amidotransferase subunit C n=1 Tax=Tropilaelaps mercedesae TaxID=418985 RepID=A0A1V9XJC7_9ACAR|nr:glutamyl-tRNA(Gln) amidotransferase subunit C [Tropilaelaps mercedesae]